MGSIPVARSIQVLFNEPSHHMRSYSRFGTPSLWDSAKTAATFNLVQIDKPRNRGIGAPGPDLLRPQGRYVDTHPCAGYTAQLLFGLTGETIECLRWEFQVWRMILPPPCSPTTAS